MPINMGALPIVASAPLSMGAQSGACTPAWHVVQDQSAYDGSQLQGLARVASDDLWAVGSATGGDRTLIEHWDGRGWSITPSPTPPRSFLADLNAATAVSAHDVWAVGDAAPQENTTHLHPLIEHWDGVQWTMVSAPTPQTRSFLEGVAAVARNDVWAVGHAGEYDDTQRQLIEHWNGQRWSIVPSPRVPGVSSALYGVSAASASDVWAVGYLSAADGWHFRALIEHWDGRQWRMVPTPGILASRTAVLNAVMAASAHDVWAVGSSNPFSTSTTPPIVAHWDGVRWHVVAGVLSRAPDIGSDGLHAVTALASDDVWIVGEDGLIEHWDGAYWHIVASAEVVGMLTALVPAASGELWAVSDRSEIAHYTAPVCRLDRPIMRLVRTTELGLAPLAVALDARVGRAFVSTSAAFAILDATSGSLIRSVLWSAADPGAAQPGSVAVDEITGRVFVAHGGMRGSTGAVAVFDTTSGALMRLIPGSKPRAVAVATHSGRAFALFAGAAHDPSAGSVAVLDAVSGMVRRVTPVGTNPTAVATDERSGHVFVANAGSGTVSMLDARTGAGLRTITLGAHPMVLAVASAQGRVVIGSHEGALYILDAARGRPRHTIRLRTHSTVRIHALTTDDRTGLAYVAWDDTKRGYVSILDLRSGLVHTLPVVGTPVALAGDRGRLVVASQGGAQAGRPARTGSISIVEKGRIQGAIPVPGRPVAVAVDAPAQRIIVLSQDVGGPRSGSVTVLRARTEPSS